MSFLLKLMMLPVELVPTTAVDIPNGMMPVKPRVLLGILLRHCTVRLDGTPLNTMVCADSDASVSRKRERHAAQRFSTKPGTALACITRIIAEPTSTVKPIKAAFSGRSPHPEPRSTGYRRFVSATMIWGIAA
jgi:hypothetical protein